MTNTETTKITNKEPTETTVINKKPAPNNIFSDTESDEKKKIHQNKNPEIDVLFTLMICGISQLSSNELNT